MPDSEITIPIVPYHPRQKTGKYVFDRTYKARYREWRRQMVEFMRNFPISQRSREEIVQEFEAARARSVSRTREETIALFETGKIDLSHVRTHKPLSRTYFRGWEHRWARQRAKNTLRPSRDALRLEMKEALTDFAEAFVFSIVSEQSKITCDSTNNSEQGIKNGYLCATLSMPRWMAARAGLIESETKELEI